MAVNNMSSMLRISGISSGLDTDSMVKSLMKLEQLRVDQVLRQKTKLEWAKDARQDINKQINDFRYKFISVLSNNNLGTPGAFKLNKIELSAPSAAISITATGEAATGSHTVRSVSQLAAAASVSSADRVSSASLNRSTALKDLDLNTKLEFDENDEISFKINDRSFTFKSTDSLDKMLRTVSNSEANVTMSYSAISGGFKIESKTIGLASELTLENISGNTLAGDSALSAFGISTGAVSPGKNALLNIDGFDIEQSSNRFTLDGMVFDLKAKFSESESVSFTVSQDVDSIIGKVKAFVEDYNKLLDTLNGKLNEKIEYSYEPLTDEQKEAMSEKEIEKWEDLAKSGLMRSDRQLSGLLSEMRGAIYQTVAGVGKSMFDVGIKTGSWMDRGKLVLDENKLRDALQQNPDEVAAVFAQTSTAADPVVKRSETGFMQRIAGSMSNYTSSYNAIKADLDIGKVADRIKTLQDAMFAKEETYWRRFSAMETALGSLNSQSSWLSQQIGSMW